MTMKASSSLLAFSFLYGLFILKMRYSIKGGAGMSILYPDVEFDKIYDIDLNFLNEHNIKGLILDVDNTLTTHNNPMPDSSVLKWLDMCRENGIKLIILSNNTQKRVEPFAKQLGMDFVSDALKPRKYGYEKAVEKLNLKRENIASVGDQLLTDIAGGNRCGVLTILVQPFDTNENIFILMKRQLEKLIMKTRRK